MAHSARPCRPLSCERETKTSAEEANPAGCPAQTLCVCPPVSTLSVPPITEAGAACKGVLAAMSGHMSTSLSAPRPAELPYCTADSDVCRNTNTQGSDTWRSRKLELRPAPEMVWMKIVKAGPA